MRITQNKKIHINEKKDQRIYLRVTQEQKECIRKRMNEMGIRNMSAFILKMTLNGYCVKLDLKDVRELVFLLRMCSNNLNQYTKKAHETGCIYYRDIVDLAVRLEKIWVNSKAILERLAKI